MAGIVDAINGSLSPEAEFARTSWRAARANLIDRKSTRLNSSHRT